MFFLIMPRIEFCSLPNRWFGAKEIAVLRTSKLFLVAMKCCLASRVATWKTTPNTKQTIPPHNISRDTTRVTCDNAHCFAPYNGIFFVVVCFPDAGFAIFRLCLSTWRVRTRRHDRENELLFSHFHTPTHNKPKQIKQPNITTRQSPNSNTATTTHHKNTTC